MNPARSSVALLALLALGCGTDVAQTATVAPPSAPSPPPLDCTPPSTTPMLPADPNLGAGDSIDSWVLAQGDYTSGQGPGITVAARDAFRLYVNGHLLAEGTASLEPEFVPLTLLPGQNAVSVVVTAASGPPALLAVIDELERPYVTDGSWKVNAQPTGDWSAAGYDDRDWDKAEDRGAPEDSPGCDPGAGFPAGEGAHWIAASSDGSAVFRLHVDVTPVGYGAGTTGGGTTSPVLVTNVDDFVSALKADGPKVLLLDEHVLDARRTGDDIRKVQACPSVCPDDPSTTTLDTNADTCDVTEVEVERNDRRVDVSSDTTLVGIGRGGFLRGATLYLKGSSNIIVRNLTLFDVNPSLIEAGDGITLEDTDGVWVDHVTFKGISDGFIDATSGATNVTFSWLHNDGANMAACLDKHPRSNELSDTTATIHHTLWEHVNERAPLVTNSQSRVHLYNNVVSDDVAYAVGSQCGAQVLLEGSTFESVLVATRKTTCDSSNPGLIAAQGRDNHYGGASHQIDDAYASEPNDAVFSLPYSRTLDTAENARFLVTQRAGAGSRWKLPVPWP